MPGMKEVPGFSQGVRANSAVRMLKMARPICPNSKVEMEWRDGKLFPKEQDPQRQNCQLAGGEWWVGCEKKGHKPYESTYTWTTKEPTFSPELDAEGKPTSRMVMTGENTFLHSATRPNFAQVAISIRINSGQGARKAMTQKGFKLLSDVGYKDVCQFRNCQKRVSPGCRSRKYGNYCSPEHLQLIAADQQGIFLHAINTGVEGPLADSIADRRDKQLREAAAFAVDSV